ncbi:MAG: orotidine 5'-phosphate decarboxylase [Candidatus Zambryskibacteria bacterium RIFCSPLOWO2_01_FULL_39_39]|uniref:Orotidine 5'-phosphate decarboxylase n=1 Tax=Candidatus Zambryskibacteria bacterium RIFCSPLOWO2_01_FULL_39_39 TaxID=1802758 RepID=A0A1G2TWS4_9BACT|nr:MAG: Orotidine 5'-phosphate decarboxylase [Parcubacteria group bacterium GW2011_GWA1_38_7]OHA87341.1 MAG: orotidine 5'-phosphate decarboxylase [Candidatus Zambryskibacteria bacterium RIFCSPHIGHO2_01_FULL_39_63]OHA95316.1 MAG: orotidine 5'-phosphate decarboxylase [Candidatus Zambryskibacteria bacterium RIFCSPHIGHO2_02_FULL_39_19]OHA98894.1 MAG: orotidine 5'-phosphate decarboxylase [Candidatus Zambryskibacteria bacterium RIFCSPHIGHO2_12_FULL_39_21]OHB01747.1 MAG: orotidine 5'-phosphate decarbo
MQTNNRIILAVDELSLERCLELVSKIGKRLCAVKIHNIYDQNGPEIVWKLKNAGASRVFVDAKLHDIPNTVRLRAKAIADSGAEIITVHASGGIEMMRVAVRAFPFEVFAVTVLTSLNIEQTHLIYGKSPKDVVLYLAKQAKLAGCAGVVCSSKEVGILSKIPELRGLKFMVPGVRSLGKALGDQSRVDTPVSAIKKGATYIVVGREVTEDKDPVKAFLKIESEISEVCF